MHRLSLVAVPLVLALASASAVAAKPKRARLVPTRPRRAYRRAWDGSYAVWAKGSVAVRKAKIGRQRILLFDVDGNGSWSDFGTDAWTVEHEHIGYAVPLERDIALDARRFTLEFGEDGATVSYLAHEKSSRSREADAVRRLNVLRMSNGLPPVWIDPVRSAKCGKHALYMDLNGIGHHETPGRRGYTPEGAEAGLRSSVCYDDPVDSVDRFWRSLFHRTGPCNPEARVVGIASSKHHTALWAERARRPWTYPVLIPAPGATDVQVAFDPLELPRPSPELPEPGMPVQALWRAGARPPTPAHGELRLESAKGRLVAAVFSSPARPAHASQPLNRFSLCLLPEHVLQSGKSYWIRMRWPDEGGTVERTWSFTCR